MKRMGSVSRGAFDRIIVFVDDLGHVGLKTKSLSSGKVLGSSRLQQLRCRVRGLLVLAQAKWPQIVLSCSKT